MSKRTALFIQMAGEKPADTLSNIQLHNSRTAKDRKGNVCTLPMQQEKAIRITANIHKRKGH